MRSGHRRLASLPAVLKLGAVLLAAALVRLAHWPRVFQAAGVRFAADSDPLYHVLQAERFLRSGLASLWTDPGLNWPHGAAVPWPPLFDVILAGAGRAVHGAALDRAGLEQVSAVVPVVLGVATVALLAPLARRLLGGGGAGAALVLALLPAHASYSVVGRADQHVLEILLSCFIQAAFLWSFVAASARRRALAVAGTAVGLTLSFWTWMGSGFNLVVPVGFACAAHVLLEDEAVARRIDRSLAAGLGGAAALLALTLASWGPPGALREGTIQGLTGLHVAVLLGGAACGALLLAGRTWRPRRGPAARALEVAVALLVPAAALLAALPPLREGVRVGLTALAAANPWYDDIAEFRPLLFSCHTPLRADVSTALALYGLTIPAALLAVPSLLRRWRERRGRPEVLLLGLWTVAYLAFALLRRRFAPYLSVPLSIMAWEGVQAVSAWLSPRLGRPGERTRALVAAGVAVAVLAPAAGGLLGFAQLPEAQVEAARWLATQPPRPGAEGVAGSWDLGHELLYYARKPVVVTPFGTEGGRGAMEAEARIDLGDPARLDDRLRARRAGWIALLDPVVRARMEATLLGGASRVQAVRQCTLAEGKVDSLSVDFLDTPAARLFYFDGLSAPQRPAPSIDGVRLVYESPASPPEDGRPSDQVKIFGAVVGARVEVDGAGPAQPVRATVGLRTNQGRELAWSTVATADGEGRAELRLPYATGMNGAVEASRWQLSDGARGVDLSLSEAQVATGEAVEVRLAGPEHAAGGHPARDPR